MEKPLQRNLNVNTGLMGPERNHNLVRGENSVQTGCGNHYLGPGKHFGICWDPAQDFTEDDAEGKHIHLQDRWDSGRRDRACTEAKCEEGAYQQQGPPISYAKAHQKSPPEMEAANPHTSFGLLNPPRNSPIRSPASSSGSWTLRTHSSASTVAHPQILQ